MALNVSIDLTGVLESILIDQKGKKRAKSIRELRTLLIELGALKFPSPKLDRKKAKLTKIKRRKKSSTKKG